MPLSLLPLLPLSPPPISVHLATAVGSIPALCWQCQEPRANHPVAACVKVVAGSTVDHRFNDHHSASTVGLYALLSSPPELFRPQYYRQKLILELQKRRNADGRLSLCSSIDDGVFVSWQFCLPLYWLCTRLQKCWRKHFAHRNIFNNPSDNGLDPKASVFSLCPKTWLYLIVMDKHFPERSSDLTSQLTKINLRNRTV